MHKPVCSLGIVTDAYVYVNRSEICGQGTALFHLDRQPKSIDFATKLVKKSGVVDFINFI